MKLFAPISLLVVGMLAGCATNPPASAPAAKSAASVGTPAPIVTPDNSLTAKVVSYNSVGRFVVLSFPISQVPKLNQNLFLYRNGLKVAELKITGPQRDNNIVADVVKGDAQVGDEVRDK
ncbi:MAG: hypothetical protein WDM76_10025 [Limisphaerales bacterium]